MKNPMVMAVHGTLGETSRKTEFWLEQFAALAKWVRR